MESLPTAATSQWPGIILELLDASSEGPVALAAAGVAAARRLTGAVGAALIRWEGDRGGLLAQDGEVPLRLDRRPLEGATAVAEQPLAVIPVEAHTDLVVAGRPGGAGFEPDAMASLRAIAALLGRSAEQATEAIGALYRVATKILGSLDLDEVLLAVVNAAAQLLRAEIAGIFLLDPSGNELEMRCAVGHRSVATAKLRVRRGQGLAGAVLRTGRIMRVDDYATDPSISKDFLQIATEEGTQSAISAPLLARGRPIGVLNAWRRRRSVFTDNDMRMVGSLAHLAAVAVENARLYEAKRTAAEQLRRAHDELQRRYRAAERAIEIHQRLTHIAVSGDDVASVVQAVSSLTKGSVVLLGDDLRTFAGATAGGDGSLLERVTTWLRANHALAADRASFLVNNVGDDDGRMVIAPVRASGVLFGYLCLGLASPLDPGDIVAAEQAATVCALLLARQEAALSTTRRLQSEFIWELLEGRLPDEAEALTRARHLGHGFEFPARVILVVVQGLGALAQAERWSAERLERTRAQLARTLSERIGQASMTRVIVAPRADTFAVVVPTTRGRHAASPQALGRAAVAKTPLTDVSLTAGISGEVDTISAFPTALRQAQFALSVASPAQPVGVFDDLGVLQFLLSPATRADLESFAERLLGPLLAYDRAHRTQLVRSLEAYLASDCNLQRAAERLYVHPKTMRYRLQRIRELAGLGLDRQEDRFNLQLALRIQQALKIQQTTARG